MDSNKTNPAPLAGGSSVGSIFGNQAGKPASASSTSAFGFGGGSGAFGVPSATSSTTPQTSPFKTAASSFNFTSSAVSNNPSGASIANTATPSSSLFGGGNATGTTPAAPKGLFGNVPSSAATGTTSSTTTNLFGNSNINSSNLFGNTGTSITKQPAAATQAAKPGLFGSATSSPATGSNPFAIPSVNSGSTPASTTANTSFAFGAPLANQPANDANKSENLFGAGQPPKPAAASPGGLFGVKPADPSPSNNSQPSVSNATPAASPAPATSLFASIPSKVSTSSTEPPAKPPASSPFGNMSSSGLTVKSTVPAKSSPLAMNSSSTGDGSLANKSATSKPASTPPATPSTKPNINLAPSLLKGKTLEDLVARWNSELDERVEDFKHTANEIAAWDQVLIQNGDQISMLYDELQQIEPIQNSIDQTLDYVESQQKELSAALEDYERQLSNSQVQDFSATSTGRGRTAAQEREEAYKTAEEVHVQLNDMASSLGTMIAELNSLAGPGNRIDESLSSTADGAIASSASSNEDPIVQISGILNAHLGSLNWIGEISQELGAKVNELEARVSNTKVEFGLESNLNHHRQIEFNSDEYNPNSSATGLNGSNLHSGPSNRVPSGLLSHPRR
ncbi:hypothetical protein PCASD_00918 [Puccinia coronata f. sp. avenae]|uniref:Nucleoporin NSP1 n=1 Tax=Puccinia coronata f. sp. avenae TaxID=200324 RepID=A0A2N5VPK8_9BASI|nr:hypothetical protein PCASD_00918 [Puccinia coronata f. sp. avenae]